MDEIVNGINEVFPLLFYQHFVRTIILWCPALDLFPDLIVAHLFVECLKQFAMFFIERKCERLIQKFNWCIKYGMIMKRSKQIKAQAKCMKYAWLTEVNANRIILQIFCYSHSSMNHAIIQIFIDISAQIE